ncbi:hypothetical protein DXN04_33605 [Chitinophaga silvisoli]|uniref:Uncharacterized protein n=1 Tax=Chitinophaga silvisoli TaxID=2291814 RepID=A0A3E1NMY8_9BACT|nr:hypothetical protein DXN04_33605 [Chitinophaga silvisoli]
MNNNYIKKIITFNLIIGLTGISVLWMLVLLMRLTKRFVNIFFMLPHIIIYMLFLNVGYFILLIYSEKIERVLNVKYSLKRVYLLACIIINFLLGIAMILEFSLY